MTKSTKFIYHITYAQEFNVLPKIWILHQFLLLSGTDFGDPHNIMDSKKIAYAVENIYWPFRSPDLTPMYFFLWNHLKDWVYIGRSTQYRNLKQSIHKEITFQLIC